MFKNWLSPWVLVAVVMLLMFWFPVPKAALLDDPLTEPAADPICVTWNGRASVAGRRAIDGLESVNNSKQDEIRERVTAALNYCRADHCPEAALDALNRIASEYFEHRTLDTTHLYRKFGEPGLKRAQARYSSIIDLDIVDALKEHRAAGRLDYSRLKRNAREAAHILFKDAGNRLEPCRIDSDPDLLPDVDPKLFRSR